MALPFSPTASVTATLTTTQGVITVGGYGRYMRLVNAAAGNAYVGFYEPGQAAPTLSATASMLIPAGAIEMFSVASDATLVAVLGDATGTSLNATRGVGA